MGLDTLKDGIVATITEHPLGAAVGATGVAIGGGLGAAAIIGAVKSGSSKRSKNKRSRKRITHSKRGWKQDRARRSKQPWEISYRRRKAKKGRTKSRKGVHYARKTGQPYIILASGKAKFIKGKRRLR